MYNINILTECKDELVRTAIISAVCESINGEESSLTINRMKHGRLNSPVWSTVSRQENINKKF